MEEVMLTFLVIRSNTEGVMTDQTVSQSQDFALSTQSRIATVCVTALLGIFLIYGVGFAQPSLLHNAAHDGRHAHVFPCH